MGLRQLDNTGKWKVDGNPIYIPDADVTVQYSSLASEDSGRDESGYMHITWLRPLVRKVGLKYAMMTGDELEYMRLMMQGKEFSFTFADSNGVTTMDAYTSEINATLYTRLRDVDLYKDVTINVIER